MNTTAYTPGDAKQNDRSNGFGRISLQTGTEVGLRFSLVDSGTGEPVTPERVDFAMYDFDKGSIRGGPRRSVCSYETESRTYSAGLAYTVPFVTELELTNTADTTTVTAKAAADGKDNPTDPFNLNEEQQQRVIMFSFNQTSSWEMTFRVHRALSGANIRNFMFAGYGAFELPVHPHRAVPAHVAPPDAAAAERVAVAAAADAAAARRADTIAAAVAAAGATAATAAVAADADAAAAVAADADAAAAGDSLRLPRARRQAAHDGCEDLSAEVCESYYMMHATQPASPTATSCVSNRIPLLPVRDGLRL